MMFNMVKKDMFGGLRETYVTDLSLIEDVLTMKPVEAKTTGDSFTKLNNAMTSLKNDMAKGRALAQLIMHMSHLTPVGWGYFACSVVLSGICYPSSKKMIPCFIRKQSKKMLYRF